MFNEPTAEEKAKREAFENTPIGQLTVAQFRELMASIALREDLDKKKRKLAQAQANPYQGSWLHCSY